MKRIYYIQINKGINYHARPYDVPSFSNIRKNITCGNVKYLTNNEGHIKMYERVNKLLLLLLKLY